MLLEKNRIAHLQAITHETKVLLFATDVDGRIWYTTRQEGFEPQFLATPTELRTGWEVWRELPLPADQEDPSVLEHERAELTRSDDPDAYLLRSRYHTRDDSAVAPVQLVSAKGHLYVFRQSKAGTLYCDRFVHNSGNNLLTRKLEVRFKRSRLRHAPAQGMRDTLDFSDLDGSYFYEPTTELCLVRGLRYGWFSVVRIYTTDHDVQRWHVFAYDGEPEHLEVITLSVSEDGLFDVRDFVVHEPTSSADPTLIPRKVPGVQRRTIHLGATVTNGPTATCYDLQRETGDGERKRLLKTATRIMLAVPTDKGTVALSFAIGSDGMLSRLTEEPATTRLRAKERYLPLPLSTLAGVRAIADASPEPTGVITSLQSSPITMGLEGRVVVASPEAGSLEARDRVEIRDTRSYDGVYRVSKATPDSFEVSVEWTDGELGRWQKHEEPERGHVFDSMVTGYGKTAEGTLEVTARNHGLEADDEVELVGLRGLDGTYSVAEVDEGKFVVYQSWPEGEALNLTALRRKRRGLSLDGVDDYAELPPDAVPAGRALTISFWAKGGAVLPKDAVILSAVGEGDEPLLRICVPDAGGDVVFEVDGKGAGQDTDRIRKAAEPAEYRDQWIHWTFVRDAVDKSMRIYKNGGLWHEQPCKEHELAPATRVRLGASAGAAEPASFYSGQLGDVRIFGRVLGEDEIRRAMVVPLAGMEVGLCAYYRLAALREGDPPSIVDLSTHAHDGTVHGGACVGLISLPRALGDGAVAVAYESPELVAVEELGDYVAELELRVHAEGDVSAAALASFGGEGRPIFRLSYRGTAGRSQGREVVIPVAAEPFEDLGDGFVRARGRFTVPTGVAMVQAFRLTEVAGDFESLEIRRYRLCKLDDAVTEARYEDSPGLVILAGGYAAVDAQLDRLRAAERRQAELRLEQVDLLDQLDGLMRLEETKLRFDALRLTLPGIREAQRVAVERYQQLVDHPLSYYCWLHNDDAAGQNVQLVPRERLVPEMEDPADIPAQKWCFRAAGGGAHFIETATTGPGQRLGVSTADSTVVAMQVSADVPTQRWKLRADGSGGYVIHNEAMGEQDQLQLTKYGRIRRVELKAAGEAPRFHFSVTPTDEQATDAIAEAQAEMQRLTEELSRMEAELAALEVIATADEPQRIAWRKRLHELRAELDALRADMGALNGEIVTALGTVQPDPLVMPQVAVDARGLRTLGAVLEFSQPASRLSSLQSCEGNVELGYFDRHGRMRRTCYDATADERNNSYEEWVDDGPRTCLDLSTNGGIVALPEPLDLAPEHAVEAWAYFPLPPRDWNVLISDEDGSDQPVVVRDGRFVGVRSEGFFFAAGSTLADLAVGWHHVAAVRRGKGAGATVSFYVDGKPFGATVSPRAAALHLDGINDYVELPPPAVPTGAQLSVAFWARADSSRGSVVIQAVGSLGLPVLSIALPDDAGALSFECGNDGQTVDGIAEVVRREEYRESWAHFVFTKNATTGAMRIYRNGKLWHSEPDKTRLLPPAVKMILGRACDGTRGFEGYIADLRLWSRELSEAEVASLLGAPLPGVHAGLLGSYQLETGEAVDSTPAARHGTLYGAPRLVEVVAGADRMAYLGNSPSPSGAVATPAPLLERVMSFDGDDAYVELPPIELDPSQGFTVELWARYGSLEHQWAALIDLGNASEGQRIVLNNNGDDLYLVVFAGTKDQSIHAPNVIRKDQWVHIAATVDPAGNATLYIDGRQVAAGSLPNADAVLRSQCSIGRNVCETSHFDGQLAEVRLWSVPRSGAEIRDSMYHRLTGREPGLAGYWPLADVRVDADTGNVPDFAGALDGTAMGGAMSVVDETLPVGAMDPCTNPDECFGRLAEVRVWGTPLRAEEIATNSKVMLTGNEPGVVAYYRLDDGRGALVHDATTNHEPAVVRRRLSAAVLSFDGIDDRIEVPDHPSLRLSTYTVEVWVKPHGLQPARWTGLFGKAGRCFSLWVMNSGQLHHRFHVGGNCNAGAPNSPSGSVRWHHWNHLAITNDGQTARTYVNGELVAQGPTGGTPVAHSTPLFIGADCDGRVSFNGRMADMRVWDHARSPEEIRATMQAAVQGDEEGLVACWPLSAIQTVDGTRTVVDLTGTHRAVVHGTGTVTDATLPVPARARTLPDPGQWWGFTGAVGTLEHQVLAFDGEDDHLELPALDPDYGQGLTLEAWVRYDSFEHWSRIFDLSNGPGSDNIVFANEDKTDTLALAIFRGPSAMFIKAPGVLKRDRWTHLAATVDPSGTGHLYLDGKRVASGAISLPNVLERARCYVGRSAWDTDGYLHGRVAEARIWSTARTESEIRGSMYERLTGHEPGLAAYWPLRSTRPGPAGTTLVDDHAAGARHATLRGSTLVRDNELPLGADALIAAEHRAADIDPATGKPYLLMRRLHAFPTPEGAQLLPGKRIEELTVEWIGNAQFEPTLLGYIEGAPPVPSENLTESDDYNGATSVELTTTEDVEFRWSRSDDFGAGGSIDLFIGADVELLVGLGAYAKVLDLSIGARGSLNFSTASMHESNITSQSSLRMTDRLELRGTAEEEPKFPELGRRFIPKNVGYALLISGLADVYVTRLARSGKMIAYQARPVEGLPPEVNTVTFLMNPAYVMQGSLDGMTGSRPTSNRYMRRLPELRAQFGSTYPCSFYRPEEAHALEQEIELQDKQRELVYAAYQIKPGFEEFADPGAEVTTGYKFERQVTDTVAGWPEPMQQAWKDPNITSPPDDWDDDWVKKWNKEESKQQREQAEESKGEHADMIKATKAKIETLADKVGQLGGTVGLEEWQTKMEDLRVAAGKRNIVNTYVWDADGGLRSEAQSFASTVEHTIGGSFTMDGSLGLEASITAGGFKGELTAMATMNMTQTVNKTETYTKGVELLVDLAAVESVGVTDYDDRPLMPGEKVDRYRFKSFYLESSTKNYTDFFRTVVHPEWLRSNDEEAVLLRQAMGKANKAWRVLHRVTYVERPGTLSLAEHLRRSSEEGA